MFFLCARGKGFPSCLPSVSILVSLSVPNFSPYFSISIAILSLGAFGQRNLLVSRFSFSLPIAQCSSFWLLWGQDPPCVPSVSTLVSLLLSSLWLSALSVSGAQYAPCPLSVSMLVRLLLSNSCPYFLSLSLSLSFSVLLSGCFYGHILSSAPICFHTCLPCSLQVVSLTPSPLLFFSQAALGSINFLASYVSPTFLPLFRSLCSSLTCCACLCSVCFGTKPIVRYIPLTSVSTTCYTA